MADVKPAKPTPETVRNSQDMYDGFIHISKISIVVTIVVLIAMYVGLVAF